ncbi:hypothetical protein P4C99_15845 [Pontiellaceae bacterium B1224]|nr:hypothetical protein [Pontiellaceae bacterium B1224]
MLILSLIAGGIIDYHKLKKYVPTDACKDRRSSFRVIDVLFNPAFRDQPQARKIQKRAIWLFCAALVLVHASKEIYQ